ncbi:ankyrin repeat domain-containing protein [Wolbachia endosymbiont of Zygogramma bicolorata]|uniref:ankyrin repeat domain-containing protein n=1 Tax=Wolbachia endosymbiont of Zygogramma bicolorata TaxID=3134048 RepID=UPI003DA9213C
MPYRNVVTYYGAYGGGDNTASQARNPTTSRQLSESTKQLFEAIDNGYLEGFKQALKEGGDVNAFDEEGMTPLMSIVNVYVVSGDKQPTLEKMSKLLIQNSNIDINAQSREYVYEERQKKDEFGRLVYLSRGQEVVEVRPGYYIYCNNGQPVDNMDDQDRRRYFNSYYDGVNEKIRTSKIKKNTVLHIACQVGAKDIVKILLTHPGIKTDVKNCEDKEPKRCIARGFEDVIKLEFKKAQKANELLDALYSRDFDQANMLLNEELNPNCWRRVRTEEITTPLSLIIILGAEKITENGKQVLIKLLKHKELDLNQIKSTPAMIQRKQLRKIIEEKQLKQIIEQAIKERLIDAINSKNLDDVKKLVEDNDFMNYAIIIAAWRNVNNPIESIVNYLNEKFPANTLQPLANTNNIPEDFKEFVQEFVDELKKTEAQLAETEQKLDKVVREKTSETSKISQLERDRLSSENRLLRTKSLSNKNEKSSQAISPGKKQSNYAYAFFILSGALTGCVGLAILYDYLVIGACLTAVALVLFLVGYYLCKADERDIGPGGTTDNPQVTRVLISSPGPAENFCTC